MKSTNLVLVEFDGSAQVAQHKRQVRFVKCKRKKSKEKKKVFFLLPRSLSLFLGQKKIDKILSKGVVYPIRKRNDKRLQIVTLVDGKKNMAYDCSSQDV